MAFSRCLTLALILASFSLALSPPVHAEKIKVVFGNAAPLTLQSTQRIVAEQLGYFEQEGIAVQDRIFPGGANALAQTVNKQADLSNPGNEPVIIGKQKGRDPLPVKFFYNALPTVIWEMVVPEASEIRLLKDLDGKRIGVFAPSASNVPQIKAILRREGIDPAGRVTLRTIGFGANALNALVSGRVDVVALMDAEHAIFETRGVKLRRLPTSPVVEKLFSNGLLTHEDNLKNPKRRGMLVKYARAYAKATLFCDVNPQACVQIAFKAQPELRPTGIDDKKALSDAVYVVGVRNANLKLRDYQKGQYGFYDRSAWQAYVDFLLAEKELQERVEVGTLFTNELIPEINAFDREAIIRQAKAAQ
jgi:NitT/TauT family transport system substrate-binding protein